MTPDRQPSEYAGLFAELYDLLHASQGDAGRYLALAERHGGPVLELGCGTGRVLVPLAAAGHEVVGIDDAPDMLAICKRKLGEARAHLVRADMRGFRLRRRFRLVLLLCNTFWHCLTRAQALAALASVREHLHPAGRFALDVSLPDERALEDTHMRTETAEYPDGDRTLVCEFTPRWDATRRIEHDVIVLRDVRGGRVTREEATEVDLRVYSAGEIRELLAAAGLELLEEPLAPSDREALFICRAP